MVRASASVGMILDRQGRPIEAEEESFMRDKPEHSERAPAAKACAVCSCKFGLIRYYSSERRLLQKYLDRFRARRERDRRWLFQISGGVRIQPFRSAPLRQFCTGGCVLNRCCKLLLVITLPLFVGNAG